MSSRTLTNYIRASRKKFGFSQKELAILLGCENGEAVSRYERFVRIPTLRTALALEIVLKTAVNDLFRGEFRKVERLIQRRAKQLSARLEHNSRKRATSNKMARLKEIISSASLE